MVASTNDETRYSCKKCNNSVDRSETTQKETRTKILKCEQCDYSSTLSFNMNRHIQRTHVNNKKKVDAKETLSNLLDAEGLSNLKSLFQKEYITLEMLIEMGTEDMRRMIKDLGIS